MRGCSYQDFVFACVIRGVFEVHSDQVAGKLAVSGLLDAVEDKVDQVESTQEGRRQIDVLRDRQIGVILAADWVGGSQNGCPGVEGCDDTGFGD